MMHTRTGALVELLGRSALDPSVINVRTADGREVAAYASDYVEHDDVAEQADALAAVAGDR